MGNLVSEQGPLQRVGFPGSDAQNGLWACLPWAQQGHGHHAFCLCHTLSTPLPTLLEAPHKTTPSGHFTSCPKGKQLEENESAKKEKKSSIKSQPCFDKIVN